ncbi:MAG TPA: HAD family hydrolase [Armatimonadota bacterium]|jgi:phosphoglycolate phosphatase-like HAD superfamily hydrolase
MGPVVCDEFEIVQATHPRGAFRFALFDFDGTLSLIRQGWQDVMAPMMVEFLLETNSGESTEEIDACVREFIDQTTGKQTIYQMMQLCDEIAQRGGTPREPMAYKALYNDRLWTHIQHRVAGLQEGSIARDTMMVPGSEAMLQGLRARGVSLFLASGTDEVYVRNECAALGLTSYFDGGVYGAQDDLAKFSKKMIIERILREHRIHGSALLGFGDGFVEIENTKEVEGVAIGVATDEVGLCACDPWKRQRLISAGADLIIPHFRHASALLAYLFSEE